MEKTLKELFLEHKGKVSDKWSFYLNEWDRLFITYRDKPIQFLEIGIQNGGSLEVWGRYFSIAKKIIGCDIDPKCELLRYEDNRIAVIVGDANSLKCESEILQQAPIFDIILDDGSHISGDIVRSFARYFPHLSDGGIYIVEDIHTSYWNDYGGGLCYPLSAMAFFKRLADVVNHEHWRNNNSRGSFLKAFAENFGIEFEEIELQRIHSVEFLNSLCIIKKLPSENNVLGKRIIVGTDEGVTEEWEKYNGIVIQDFAMVIKDDSNLDVFELVARNNSLSTELEEKGAILTENNRVIQAFTGQVEGLTAMLAERDWSVQALTEQSKGLSAMLAERDTSINLLNGELQEVKNSRFWGLFQFLLRLRSYFLRYKNTGSTNKK